MELSLPWFGPIGVLSPRELTHGTLRQRLERVLAQAGIVILAVFATQLLPLVEGPACIALEGNLPFAFSTALSCSHQSFTGPSSVRGGAPLPLPHRAGRIAWAALPAAMQLNNPTRFFDDAQPLLDVPTLRITQVTPEARLQPAPKTGRPGSFVWPVRGSISSGYGPRRNPVTRRREFHPAIDIRATYNTPVLSAGTGTVIAAGYLGALGRVVRVKSGDMVFTYAHLRSIHCHLGATVRPGQLLGRVGASGRCTGPHLHFAVTRGRSMVNPLTLLP